MYSKSSYLDMATASIFMQQCNICSCFKPLFPNRHVQILHIYECIKIFLECNISISDNIFTLVQNLSKKNLVQVSNVMYYLQYNGDMKKPLKYFNACWMLI